MRRRVESLALGGVRPTANICTRNRGLRGGVGRNAARPCPLIHVRYSGGGTAKRLALILVGIQDHACPGWADTVDKAGFGASLDVRCYRRRTYCFRLGVMPARFRPIWLSPSTGRRDGIVTCRCLTWSGRLASQTGFGYFRPKSDNF